MIVKIGGAIAAGCTTLLKPSEETPLIALALAERASAAGLPKGVFNVVTTSQPETFADALKDQRIRMLSFTGSTQVGKHLYQLCAKTVKRVALELGGNAPFIVFDDCDINSAADALINARFYNAGQICVGANRIYVQSGIYAEFCQVLTAKVSNLRVGHSLADDIDIGPLINRKAAARLQNLIADATNKGAKIQCGGKLVKPQSLMFAPTVLTQMSDDMLACQQEIFGPVAGLYRFNDEQEVLRRANTTPAGLAAYVFTHHYPTLQRVSRQLDAGAVGANSTQLFADNLPFGGIKESGIGKEQGQGCLEEFLDSKCISFGAME